MSGMVQVVNMRKNAKRNDKGKGCRWWGGRKNAVKLRMRDRYCIMSIQRKGQFNE